MATTITKTETLVGKRIRRKEDPRLITGTATYVDDIQMPGMHHACILRSPHGAARIRSINIKPAINQAGVVAVFIGKDIEAVGPVLCVGGGVGGPGGVGGGRSLGGCGGEPGFGVAAVAGGTNGGVSTAAEPDGFGISGPAVLVSFGPRLRLRDRNST